MAGLKQITFDFENETAAEEAAVKNTVADEQPLVTVAAEEEIIIDLSETAAVPAAVIKRKKLHNKKSTRGRISLKEADSGADLIDIPDDEILFTKLYYPIGTVAEMFKVNQSLIRFWENEFDILKPRKNGKGDRLFRPEDVKNLKLIYNLLRERKYTMEGAKDFLKNSKKADEKFAMIESLKKIKGFLLELKANL
jgi:DNA-binding transcriptional MerR regulator